MVLYWSTETRYIVLSFPSFAAQPEDIINIDQLYFHFECFAEGETAYINNILINNDAFLEGPEVIGFTLGEASNVPGAMSYGNTAEIMIIDAGKTAWL